MVSVLIYAPEDSFDYGPRTGGAVCLRHRYDATTGERITQKAMCVPVVVSAHNNDISWRVGFASLHADGFAMRERRHAFAANPKLQDVRLARARVPQTRQSPSHNSGQQYQ